MSIKIFIKIETAFLYIVEVTLTKLNNKIPTKIKTNSISQSFMNNMIYLFQYMNNYTVLVLNKLFQQIT